MCCCSPSRSDPRDRSAATAATARAALEGTFGLFVGALRHVIDAVWPLVCIVSIAKHQGHGRVSHPQRSDRRGGPMTKPDFRPAIPVPARDPRLAALHAVVLVDAVVSGICALVALAAGSPLQFGVALALFGAGWIASTSSNGPLSVGRSVRLANVQSPSPLTGPPASCMPAATRTSRGPLRPSCGKWPPEGRSALGADRYQVGNDPGPDRPGNAVLIADDQPGVLEHGAHLRR